MLVIVFSLVGVCGDVETVERFPTSPCPHRPNTGVSAASSCSVEKGVELVASIGPEIELGVGSCSGSVDGRPGEPGRRSRHYAASLKCLARLSRIGIRSATIWAKNSFSQFAPSP